MKQQSIFPFVISLVLIFTWGCGDNDNNGDGKNSDAGTDQTPDAGTDDDTSTQTASDVDPNTELGTEPPQVAYDGYEEQYILTAADDPVDLCRVRFDLVAVAEPAVPCTICEWDVVVEKKNPQIILNVNNACENSDLGLDEATISDMVGERVAYGFAPESMGHANILMRFNTESGRWEEFTVSNWDSMASEFRYNRRDGPCDYTAEGEDKSGICGISGEAAVTIAVK